MAEFLFNDRLSFKPFFGVEHCSKIARCKDNLAVARAGKKHSGLDKQIFAWFDGELNKAGFDAKHKLISGE